MNYNCYSIGTWTGENSRIEFSCCTMFEQFKIAFKMFKTLYQNDFCWTRVNWTIQIFVMWHSLHSSFMEPFTYITIGVFPNGEELSVNWVISVNSGNLINQWSMKWAQFKDPVSHMCLAGTVIPFWCLTKKVWGSNPFNDKEATVCYVWMCFFFMFINIFPTHFYCFIILCTVFIVMLLFCVFTWTVAYFPFNFFFWHKIWLFFFIF